MAMRLRLFVAFVAVHCLFLTVHCHANDADSVRWEQMMEQMVVTATRTPKLLKDVPVQARVLTADDIKRADVSNVADLLQQELPGLEFSWAMSKEVNLNMSGFGGNGILFLVDGERLAGETMNNPDFHRLPLDNVERIEIVRGAASSLYGSNAVGGVINIITKKAAKPFSASLNAHTGTHSDNRFGAAFGTRLDKVSNTLSAGYTHMGQYHMSPFSGAISNQLTSNEFHTWNFSDRFMWQPAKRMLLTARAGYFYRERGYDASENNRYRDFSGGLKGEYSFGSGHSLEVAYTFDQYDKSDYSLISHYDVRDYSNVQNAVRALYNNKVCDRLTLTSGADFMRDYLLSYMFADGGRSQYTADGFVQLDYEPNRRWEVVGGIRYDYYSESSASSVTGKLAVRFRPRHDLTLRLSYSGGFRAPTLKEMYMDFDMAGIFMIYGNRSLSPERSHNLLAGMEYTHRGWNLTASVYHNFVDNRVTTIWEKDAIGLYGNKGAMRYQNIGAIDICGAEANVSKRWNRHWDSRLSYCFNFVHVRSKELYTDNTRPHSLTVRVGYDTRLGRQGNLSATLSGRYLSCLSVYELDESYTKMKTEKTRYSGYCILKLAVRVSLPKGLALNLAVDNLLDYKPSEYTYYSPKTTGTSFSAGVSFDL